MSNIPSNPSLLDEAHQFVSDRQTGWSLVHQLANRVMCLTDERDRLRAITDGCPVCSELARNTVGAHETDAGLSPTARAILDRLDSMNFALFLTSAFDHIERGGNMASGQIEIGDGVKVELKVTRLQSETNVSRKPRNPERPALDRGPAWFQKLFERIAHKDDWGVDCVYDYAAWRLCQSAVRRDRKMRRQNGGM